MKDERIQELVNKAYDKVKSNNDGKPASYIPELAKANPKLFGVCFVDCQGNTYEAGKSRESIPIESISKVFSLALAAHELGISEVNRKIGNEGSSLPFNSVVACVLSKSHTINPFVNQGAMATTSLLFNKNKTAFRNKVLKNMDKYAGKKLITDKKVYKSEMATNDTNMALAYLLKSYGRFYGNVEDTVDVYTEQCSKLVSAKDLATMACVFAKGGLHPHSNKRVLNKDASEYVYRSLRGEGLYEYSGRWDTDVGCVSAKSGVGGGILIILKGIGGIGIVSPPLDKIGNSVRGIKAGKIIAKGIRRIRDAQVQFCPNKTLKKKHKRKHRRTKKNK